MSDILESPELKKCTQDYGPGESLFLEGDDTRDMYILVSGRLEVFKDDKLLFEINKPGSLVGEMSYLLESKRTATVRAIDAVRAIKVPGDRGFLSSFLPWRPRSAEVWPSD